MPQITKNVLATKIHGTSSRQKVLMLLKEEPWCVEQVFFLNMKIYVAFIDGPTIDLGFIASKYAAILSDQIVFVTSWRITGGDLIESSTNRMCTRFGVNVRLVMTGTKKMDKALQIKKEVAFDGLLT